MIENDIIKNLKELRQIKPRENWVVLTKKQILGKESYQPESVSIMDVLLLKWKPAFATPVLLFMVIFGLTFGFAQSTVPGDFLYSVKKMTESAQVTLSPENQKTKIHLEIANKRLEELDKIATSNQVENLAPTIREFQISISEAAKNLTQMEATTSSAPIIIQEIVSETQKLDENKKKVEALGIVLGDTDEYDSALAQLVEREIRYLEDRTLTEGQQEFLLRAQEDNEAGDYSQALINILLLQNIN
ncbi:MAG TPA: DUF5667 domain-containing protein [Candidatus Parcubacteria bacterium]|jgi:hypothetical protein|nr:hypothetical protein [Parcubacteria group bacterium]HJN61991.1 DUF5667 domain-containing protein [Candidatus Parcubacteria bacterium]|tara:strand:+ start:38188 stop:38925 length:738 start_codon:yes stop_codon:yes gene_type:complete